MAPVAAGLLGLLFAGFTILLFTGNGRTAPQPGAVDRSAASERAASAYADLPLRFEANRGQTAAPVRFISRGAGYSLFLTPREAVVSLAGGRPSPGAHGGAGTERTGAVLRTRLLGANPDPRVEGLDRLAGRTNYLKGSDRTRWRTGVPGYARVRYAEAYPGIDLIYHGRQGRLEYDFALAPGADPDRIALGFRGARRLAIARSGDLVISTAAGRVRQRRPVLYQRIDGERRPVRGRYVLEGRRRVGFRVGRYDRSRRLVIDPVLAYSTYLGASLRDIATDIAAGPDGSAYVTGRTNSENFPTTAGAFQPNLKCGGPCATDVLDVFVTKLNPRGSALAYSTYLGGTGSDSGDGIAVDASGRAYVTGQAGEGADFPTTANAYDRTAPGGGDAFLSVLNAEGKVLDYSTFLGGGTGVPDPSDPTSTLNPDDGGRAVALDGANNAYVAGQTCSRDFPTKGPASTPRGGCDAFVSKLNPSGSGASSLLASRYLGGTDNDRADGITAGGSAVQVAGTTFSPDFPTTTNAYDRTAPGGGDAFLSKLSATLTGPSYSTYLGGAGFDQATDLATDADGRAYLTGDTDPPDDPTSPKFPTKGAFQNDLKGAGDVFVARLDTRVSGAGSLNYSSFLGGTGDEFGGGIGVDPARGAYVAGLTTSDDFATTDPVSPRGDGTDPFVARVTPDGSGLSFASYLGGGADDLIFDDVTLAVDSSGNAYVAGGTDSTDFPTKDPLQPENAGQGTSDRHDSFVVKIGPDPPGAPRVTGTSPRSGQPGTSVVISGSGFTGATGVSFGGTAAASFTVDSDSRITAVRPSRAAGPAAVVVAKGGTASAPDNPIARFFYAEGSWSLAGPPTARRLGASATPLPDGKVLVAGGRNPTVDGPDTARTAELYDPATGTWKSTGALKVGRVEHTATLLANGKVLVAGGGSDQAFPFGPLKSAELYDPATGTWSPTNPMIVGRIRRHTATVLSGPACGGGSPPGYCGKVLVAGGEGADGTFTDRAELYDPATEQWSDAGDLGAERASHTASVLSGPACGGGSPPGYCGKVLVVGGENNAPGGGTRPLDSAALYDPATNTWSATGSLGSARQKHTATVLADGRVLAAAGREQYQSVKSAEIYSPADGTWRLTGIMQARRDSHAAVLLPSGKLLVAGGESGQSHHNTAELWNPSSGRWTSAGVMNSYHGQLEDPAVAFLLEGTPSACGGNCGKVFVAGLHSGSADLYTPGTDFPTDTPPGGGPPGGGTPGGSTPGGSTPGSGGRRIKPKVLRPRASARQTGGSTSATVTVSRSRGKIRVRVRGRMVGVRGRPCGGRIKIGTRFGGNRRVTRTGRMRKTCRYSKRYAFSTRRLPGRLRPRRKRLILKVAVRFRGNSRLLSDVSPTRRVKVRRR